MTHRSGAGRSSMAARATISMLGGLVACVLLGSCTSAPAATDTQPTDAISPSSVATEMQAPAATEAPAASATASAPASAPAAAPVAPPGGAGDIRVSVPVAEQSRTTKAAVGQDITVSDSVKVGVRLARTTVEARGVPGEIAGPAVSVTVVMTNTGGAAADLSAVAVTVESRAGAPLSPLQGQPYAPLKGPLAPSASAEGTYVYTLDESVEQPLTILVSHKAGDAVAMFEGTAS